MTQLGWDYPSKQNNKLKRRILILIKITEYTIFKSYCQMKIHCSKLLIFTIRSVFFVIIEIRPLFLVSTMDFLKRIRVHICLEKGNRGEGTLQWMDSNGF